MGVLRDCLSGESLLARSRLSAATDDLASLPAEVRAGLAPAVEVMDPIFKQAISSAG